MKLTLEAIAAQGGFVSNRAEEKEINWKHKGQEFSGTVNVLPLSYVTVKSDHVARQIQGDALAGRIASCIVDDEGKPIFTVADVIGTADPERGPLSEGLTTELMRVIGEVSGLGKPPASSTTKTKSGTNSSSRASVAGRSRKLRKTSATPSTSAG